MDLSASSPASGSEWIFASDSAHLRPYAYMDAGILALGGGLDRAGRLVACAHRIFAEAGSIPDPDDRVELDKPVPSLRQLLS